MTLPVDAPTVAIAPGGDYKIRSTFGRSILGRLLRIRLSAFAIVFLTLVAVAAVGADVLAPYDPNKFIVRVATPPSLDHWLGTDSLGRDQLSRLMFGARASFQVAVTSTAIGVTFGLLVGLTAAASQSSGGAGIVDSLLMRAVDAQLALPGLITPLLLLAVMGGGILTVSIALGIGIAPALARLVRGQAISEMGRDYILASTAIGARRPRILVRHVLPNALPAIIVAASLSMSRAVIAEAGLSFLGVGVTPPTATWGTMLSNGFAFLSVAPWVALVPGAAIFLLVLSLNFLGDGLRDVLDPRLRGKL